MKHILLAIVALGLSACTSVRVFTPNPGIESPELRGDQGVRIDVDMVGAHKFEATGDADKRPINLNDANTSAALDVIPGVSFAFIPEIEAGLELAPFHTGIAGVVRFQPVGRGRRYAQEGDVAWGLYARAGQAESKNDTEDSTWDDFHAKIKNTFVHAGTSLGYRSTKNMLVYAGVAYGKYSVKADINQLPFASDPGGQYKATYNGDALTGGVGLQFAWRVVSFHVAAEMTHVDYDKSREIQDIYFRTGITFTPGALKADMAAPVVAPAPSAN